MMRYWVKGFCQIKVDNFYISSSIKFKYHLSNTSSNWVVHDLPGTKLCFLSLSCHCLSYDPEKLFSIISPWLYKSLRFHVITFTPTALQECNQIGCMPQQNCFSDYNENCRIHLEMLLHIAAVLIASKENATRESKTQTNTASPCCQRWEFFRQRCVIYVMMMAV